MLLHQNVHYKENGKKFDLKLLRSENTIFFLFSVYNPLIVIDNTYISHVAII